MDFQFEFYQDIWYNVIKNPDKWLQVSVTEINERNKKQLKSRNKKKIGYAIRIILK